MTTGHSVIHRLILGKSPPGFFPIGLPSAKIHEASPIFLTGISICAKIPSNSCFRRTRFCPTTPTQKFPCCRQRKAWPGIQRGCQIISFARRKISAFISGITGPNMNTVINLAFEFDFLAAKVPHGFKLVENRKALVTLLTRRRGSVIVTGSCRTISRTSLFPGCQR